jgi:pimeloyl-ACP methyl ester carboxylesterase
VLEGGTLQPLETWDAVFVRIATFAPVIAYDRRGVGQSEFDEVAQTLSHVTGSLHALLAELKVAPPYVLVGHSFGGVLIRQFAREYPGDVLGLVYVDAPDTDLTRAEIERYSADALRRFTAELDQIPSDLPPGMKAEIDNLKRMVSGDLTELNAVRPPVGIPAVVIIAAGKNDGETDPAAKAFAEWRLREAMAHELAWALASPDGLYVITRHGGHELHKDNPDLTVQAIQYVVQSVMSRR